MINYSLIKSIANALRGVKSVYKEERNFRIQLTIAVLMIILMFLFNLGLIERSIVILLILIVLILEMLNSILERFIDILKPRVHTYIKDIKDIAAGAVLIASLGSFFVGIIIFYPYIRDFIRLVKLTNALIN